MAEIIRPCIIKSQNEHSYVEVDLSGYIDANISHSIAFRNVTIDILVPFGGTGICNQDK